MTGKLEFQDKEINRYKEAREGGSDREIERGERNRERFFEQFG